jgi:phosphoadenosine phosphosulfate reductase
MDIDSDSLMGLNIEEKIEQSKKIIREAMEKFGPEKLAVAWTGGKDSTTMTWLFRETCREMGVGMPKCMFIDEGDVFDEIWDIVNTVKKDWDLDVVIAKNTDVSDRAEKLGDMIRVDSLNERNRAELEKLEFDEEEFPFAAESFIGNHLMKTVAMNVFLEDHAIEALATAIRWDEQTARVKETYFSSRDNPHHTRVQPILHFRERDIWDTIQKYGLPFCELYKQGYRSLGARSTTYKNSDVPAWEQDLENTTEREGRGQDKEEVMDKLRSLGYM